MARQRERGEAARRVEVVRGESAARAAARRRTCRSRRGRPSRAPAAGRRDRGGRARGRSSGGARSPACSCATRAVVSPAANPAASCPVWPLPRGRVAARRPSRRSPPRRRAAAVSTTAAPATEAASSVTTSALRACRRRRSAGRRRTGTWPSAACRRRRRRRPSGSFLPRRKPPTACSAMSTTSSFEAPAVRPALVVAAEHAEPRHLGRRRHRDREVDPQLVGRRVAGEGDVRDARQEHLHEIVPVRLRHAEVVELVDHGGQDRRLVVLDELRVLRRARRGSRDPSTPVGMTTSLISGLPSRETCTHLRPTACR